MSHVEQTISLMFLDFLSLLKNKETNLDVTKNPNFLESVSFFIMKYSVGLILEWSNAFVLSMR